MCTEIQLIKTSINHCNLGDISIKESCLIIAKSNISHGIYIIINTKNGMMLIGEGKISGFANRPNKHIKGVTNNSKFLKDLKQYKKESFILWGIIPENNEIQRKLIENKLQIYFKDKCYNRPKRNYPTQKELLEDKGRHTKGKGEKILNRLKNYTKIQKINNFDECWESNFKPKSIYGDLAFKKIKYLHHVLMYILHYGDICGISSVIHHKCNNKRCVNPKHLQLTTNIGNSLFYYNS